MLSSLGTLVCETQEIKSFWPALAASFTPFARITTELDQTRFSFVQLQAKLGEPRAESFQARFCLAMFSKPITKSSA